MNKAKRDKAFELAWLKADMAGIEAAAAAQVVPMVVQQHANVLDDNSPVTKQWHVEGGVCGFAWLNLSPGNHPFCNWLKKYLGPHGTFKDYHGGLGYSIHRYGQSMQRKTAHAGAMASKLHELLADAKLSIGVRSRMD